MTPYQLEKGTELKEEIDNLRAWINFRENAESLKCEIRGFVPGEGDNISLYAMTHDEAKEILEAIISKQRKRLKRFQDEFDKL